MYLVISHHSQGSAFLLISRSNAFVGHVAKVRMIQVGHHDAIGTVVTNVTGVNPYDLVAVQLDQQRRDVAVGGMGGIEHGANPGTADQLNPLADQARVTFDNGPPCIAAWPHATAIGGTFDSIPLPQA